MPARKRKDITIRFCFDKGEGEDIEISKFSEDELADIRKCLSLDLAYCPQEQIVAKIISVQIIHDGITPVEEEDDEEGIEGYYIDREDEYPLYGYPTPIVRFLLDRAMDEEEFRQSLFESSYNVCTKTMQQNDELAYRAEDHNGYTSVLSSKQRDHMINYLQINDAYCGTIFNFPDGLPEDGHLISALEFALKP